MIVNDEPMMTAEQYRSQVRWYAEHHRNWWIGCNYSGGVPIHCEVRVISIDKGDPKSL